MDNVDNKWVKQAWKSYGNHKKCKKAYYHSALTQGNKNNLCKRKNPHSKVEVFPNLNVDSVDNLLSEEMFPNIYNISGSHSYQQIAVYTIF